MLFLIHYRKRIILQGIRRIVALTGPEAERAIQRADRLQKKIDNITHEFIEKIGCDISVDFKIMEINKLVQEFINVSFLD